VQVINVAAPGGPAVIRVPECWDELLDWARWVHDRHDQPLGLDLETNALDPFDHRFRTRTVQTADGQEAWVVRPDIELPWSGSMVIDVLRDHPLWVAHFSENDVRFAVRGLGPEAIRTEDDSTPHVVDTQAVLAIYDPRTVTSANKRDRIDVRIPRPKGLKEVSGRLLGPELQAAEAALLRRFREIALVGQRGKSALKAYGFAHADVTERVFVVYAGLDPIATIRLWWLMRAELEERGQWPRAVAAMREQWQCDLQTLRGMRVDGPYARWLDGELRAVVDQRTEYLAQFGIAPSGQGPAVGRAFDVLGVTSPVIRNGSESWDRYALAQIADPEPGGPYDFSPSATHAATSQRAARWLARAVLDVRRAGKFRAAYVTPMLAALERDGSVHCSLRGIGTVTTRASAARPALQQLPKRDTRVRAAFRAERGHVFVTADFRQGEPFTMAALSGDVDYLRDLESGDINSRIAALVYGDAYDPAQGKVAGTPHYAMRQAAKFAWLAACYGAAARKVAALLGLPEERGAEIRDRWHAAYPTLWEYARRQNWRTWVALDSGAVVPLWDRFRVDDATGELVLRTWDDGRHRPSRLGLNAATQGTQADLLRAAKVELRRRGLAWALRFDVHDELVLVVPEWMAEWAREVLEECMTVTYRGVTVRCDAEVVGRTWTAQPRDFDPAELAAVDDEEE
jgi:DNA polymerase-1